MANNTDSQKGSMDSSYVRKLCIIGELSYLFAKRITEIAVEHRLTVVRSDTSEEFETETGVLFIISRFYGPVFEKLRTSHFILGPLALLQIVQRFGRIPTKSTQPLYCLALYQKKICVAGYKKQHLMCLKDMINFMGGTIRPAIKSNIALLVTSSTSNAQYREAVKANIPVRRTQWVLEIWNRRNEENFEVSDTFLENMIVTELSAVHVCFYGFCKEEAQKWTDQACSLGMSVVPLTSELCTHIVINSEISYFKSLPQESEESECAVVVLQWFILVTRMKILIPVDNYRYIRPENVKKRNSGSLKRRQSRPQSSDHSETASQNSEANFGPLVTSDDPQPCKSEGDEDQDIPTKICRVQDYLDCKVFESPKQVPRDEDLESDLGDVKVEEGISDERMKKKAQRRKFKCHELYETEKSYVDILNAINKIFKEPLETLVLEKRPLVSEQDIKVLFQKFSPIFRVHQRILADLEPILKDWTDDCAIGNIFVKYNSELNKAYPQFINYMDVILEKIEELSSSNPEFQKFLKEAESHPTCLRQGLKDLIIWPMQRIGRLILLLQGILNDTSAEHADYKPLQTAIEMMEACGRMVNEDKRITDCVANKLSMFYDIQNCPHEFLTMKQFFIAKYVVQEVQGSEGVFRKPATVALLLFKDFLEICKQRSKGITGLLHKKLPYKHLQLLPLSCVKNVVHINSPKEHTGKFAIMVQSASGIESCNIYSVLSDNIQEVVYSLSVATAKHALKRIDEIRKDMSFTTVLNFFTSNAVCSRKQSKKALPLTTGVLSAKKSSQSKSKLLTPKKSRLSDVLTFHSSETCLEKDSCVKSPKTLFGSQKENKPRRSISSFTLPIQLIATPSTPESGLKPGVSASSTNSLEPSETSKGHRKLKSNSFGARPSKLEF